MQLRTRPKKKERKKDGSSDSRFVVIQPQLSGWRATVLISVHNYKFKTPLLMSIVMNSSFSTSLIDKSMADLNVSCKPNAFIGLYIYIYIYIYIHLFMLSSNKLIREIAVRFPRGARDFSLLRSAQTGSATHIASYSLSGGKAARSWSWPFTSI